MRILLTAMSLLGLAGCAAQTPLAATAAPAASAASAASAPVVADAKVVCRRVMPIGSTIPHTVCEKEENNAAQAAQMQSELANDAQRGRPITVHSGG